MNLVFRLLVFISLFTLQASLKADNSNKNEFLAQAFGEMFAEAKSEKLWLNDGLQAKVTKILDHKYPKLRLSYWQIKNNKQTVWFLDEIGKERPISFAISIINQRVSLIKVLEFRESRGGEIQMSSFTEQFNNIGLNDESLLDQNIDGISGATMSITAMKKITRLALMLHNEVSD